MRCVFYILVFSLYTTSLICQTFSCDGNLLISYNQNAAFNQTSKVNFGPFGTLFFDPIKSFQGGQFDALGYNLVDNYIYGIDQISNNIVRLKADESFEIIGDPAVVSSPDITAGDCTPTGQYLCIENNLDQILIFDVINSFELVKSEELFWDSESINSGTFTAKLGDLAIDPTNSNFAYAYQGNYITTDLEPVSTRGFLHRININPNDPNFGMVTPVGKLSTNEVRKIGSLFFDVEGNLFGYGSTESGLILRQNKLIQIDKFTGSSSVFPWNGPTALTSDGCSCPYTLTFQCNVNPKDVLCTDSKITYNFSIVNRFPLGISEVFFQDSFPQGMIIENITGNFDGNIRAGTGIGFSNLEIEDLQIPIGGVININVDILVNDIPIDFVDNQAFLLNLPDRFGNILPSDDPGTSGTIGDPTTVIGNAQILNDFQINVTQPSNCFDVDDVIVQLSSPVFIPNETYEVKLRNENYEENSWIVDIDNSNSFSIQNILPGEYTLFAITPQSSNCSFEMKDTTIDVVAPNELLAASAESNSPVCAYSTLTFIAEASPGSTIEWDGPGLSSNDFQTSLLNAQPINSGTYNMIASLGFCEQIRTIEVEVAPDIQTEIIGKKEYCQREPMNLIAEGNGDIKTYIWRDPNGDQSFDRELNVASMSSAQSGQYNLILNNGICSDSNFLNIELLPSPTIILPDTILTDMCYSMKIEPQISGDNNVIYEWIPQRGLTCYNCPTPEILIPFDPYYKLVVANDYNCTDTSAVRFLLDTENLLYTPSAISPNNDGQNDVFQIFPGCAIFNIKKIDVFNRWGANVFSKGNIDPDFFGDFWDGKINGQIGDTGVYIYRLELELKDGTTRTIFGDLTLLR